MRQKLLLIRGRLNGLSLMRGKNFKRETIMPKLLYIGMNLLIIVMSVLNFLLIKSQNESIVKLIGPLIMGLLLFNLLIWISGFALSKICLFSQVVAL
jgi:hypothetical protein